MTTPNTAASRPSSYNRDELLRCGRGEMFGPGNAQLPLPDMLMIDRITSISATGGAHDKGFLVAEFEVDPKAWFFGCHFAGDPVMPGCLGLDALWQLTGFFLAWLGNPGRGRALGVGEVKFGGQILPTNKLVTYRIDVSRIVARRLVLALADGTVAVDGEQVYSATDLRVGLFTDAQEAKA